MQPYFWLRANICRLNYSVWLSAFLLLFTSPLTQAQPLRPATRMDYHLRWDGQSTVLQLDILYTPTTSDSTVFVYGNPGAGGQPRIFDILGQARVDAGDELVVRAAERKLIVHHHRAGPKQLHVALDGKLLADPRRALPNEAFRPTIASGFLYTLGYQLFMEVPGHPYTQIGIVWDQWPQGMPYFVSTNPSAQPSELQVIPIDDFHRNSFLLHMSSDLRVSKYAIAGIPTYLLTSIRDSTSGMPAQITALTKRFIPQVRDFWQDYQAPFYFVSAIPLRSDVSSKLTGIGLVNGFSIRYRGPLDPEKTQLIAYELSHTWIGIRLKYQSKGMENNWFNEGFNDYVALYNLARAGLVEKTSFLHHLNTENFAAHYRSPVRAMPGDSIEANFFRNNYYQKLPYQRGFIYAFYLDNQIRLATHGKQTLRHFLLKLYTQNQQNAGRPITAEDFTRAMATFLPKARIGAEITDYMLGGKLLHVESAQLIAAFHLTYQGEIPVLSLSDKADLRMIYK